MNARDAMDTINLYATLADLKDVDYKNTLAITTLIDLLVEKGVISEAEMAERAQRLDKLGE